MNFNSSSRMLASALGAALVCAACAHQAPPTVRVDALQSNIVFGLKPTSPAGVTPGQSTSPQFTTPLQQEPPITIDFGYNNPGLLPSLPGLYTNTPLPAGKCPTAALDAFPDQTAPINSTNKPSVGEYLWQLGGDQAQGISIVPVDGFEERLIRRVTPIPTIATDAPGSVDYTFQELQPYDTKGDILETTYQVRTDNNGQVYYQAPAGTTTAYVTSSDAGLSLKSEDILSPTGGITPLFDPALPLLLMPLPIEPGAQFESTAADPATGEVVVVQATALRRARVDACGTIVEGWEVIGTEEVVQPPAIGPGLTSELPDLLDPTLTTQIDDIYSPQLGNIAIAEHTLTGSIYGTVTVDDAIGQEHPSPLPPGTA